MTRVVQAIFEMQNRSIHGIYRRGDADALEFAIALLTLFHDCGFTVSPGLHPADRAELTGFAYGVAFITSKDPPTDVLRLVSILNDLNIRAEFRRGADTMIEGAPSDSSEQLWMCIGEDHPARLKPPMSTSE
jgi:hypothetical protein